MPLPTPLRHRASPFLVWLLLLLALPACTPPEQSRTTTRLAMGTLVSITTWGAEDAAEREGVAAAFAEMERIEAMMSGHRADSPLSRLNAAPRGEWREVPPELGRVVVAGLNFRVASAGAFDPGLGMITSLWGFSADPPATAPPPDEQVARWREAYRPGDLELKHAGGEFRIRLNSPAVALDLGGIAKGYAVDRAMAVLEERGIPNAIVNAGGNLRIAGSKGGDPWRIGVQHPRQADRVIAAVPLKGSVAMVTSGDYERFFLHEGRRYHHLLDPTTGQPARSGVISATVQAPDTLSADALSTAAFILGPEQGIRLLEGHPHAEGLLMLEDGSLRRTKGFIGELREGR